MPQTIDSKKWIVKLVIFAVISLIAEVFIFNFKYFLVSSSKEKNILVSASQFNNLNNAEKTSEGTAVSDGSYFSFNCSSEIKNIKINTLGDTYFTATAKYSDESYMYKEKSGGATTVNSAVDGSSYITFNSFGKAKTVTLYITAPLGAPVITSVQINAPYFNFRFGRVLFLFIILCAAALLKERIVWEKRCLIKSRLYLDSLFIIFLLGVFLSFSLCIGYGQTQAFSSSAGKDGDAYRLLTEAFYNGQFNFITAPPSELVNLINPYDPTQRGENYLFDCALFEGRYYCYFGIAPVITLLLPIKILTGLYMPTSLACLIFMVILMAGLLLFYYNACSYFFKNLSYMTFLGGAAAVIFASNIFYLIARPMFYELAVLSGLSFLFLGFSLLLSALRNKEKRTAKIFFCGVFFALTVASRPSYIIYFAAAVPLIWRLVYSKENKKFNLKLALVFLSVPIITAAFLMYYNFMRFGSPFDFGQKYQLTISDIRYNKFSNISVLPAAVFCYLFAPFNVNLTYPYFHIVSQNAVTSAGYYYNQPYVGIFNFPIMLILLLSVSILKRMPKEKRLLKQFISIVLICALLIIYLNTSTAGVLERYSLDIMPMLVLVSVLLFFEIITFMKKKGLEKPASKVFFAVSIITCVISTLAVSVGEYSIQITNNPNFYQNLSMAIEFWR